MKRLRPQLALLVSMLGLIAGLVAPGTATARGCPPARDHPVYGLSVFNGARCGAGAVVAHRLVRRYDDPGQFRSGVSRRFIYQHDAAGNRWKCQWNSASVHHDIVNWNCARRPGRLISWIWREHRL